MVREKQHDISTHSPFSQLPTSTSSVYSQSEFEELTLFRLTTYFFANPSQDAAAAPNQRWARGQCRSSTCRRGLIDRRPSLTGAGAGSLPLELILMLLYGSLR